MLEYGDKKVKPDLKGEKMNRIKLVIVLLIFVSSISSTVLAQGADVKSNLASLFEFSKAKSYEKAAALIAYEGEDKTRVQKEAFNSANKDELTQVKRICKKISALIELSSKYDFGAPSVKKDGETEIYSIEVSFISGDQKLVTEFSFIKTEKGFLLSNMN